MQEDVLLVLSTFPDAEMAERVASELVTAKLAACANILPSLKSIYRWQDEVQKATETLVFFKTTSARFPDLQAKLRAAHPYEVPEIICLPIADGLPEYLQWVAASCS
ncbi:MAG: divalent-cation tolerance protein CutA [Chthoniobacterales bacterium]